jgi:hypothetical protein
MSGVHNYVYLVVGWHCLEVVGEYREKYLVAILKETLNIFSAYVFRHGYTNRQKLF